MSLPCQWSNSFISFGRLKNQQLATGSEHFERNFDARFWCHGWSHKALIHQSRRLERPLRIRSWLKKTTWAQLENLTVNCNRSDQKPEGEEPPHQKILRWISYHSYHSYLRHPKTGKKISQEQFVKSHAIIAVPSHLCQRTNMDKHGSSGSFLHQKKYVPFNFLPFAIKGYHFFKTPKSSKVIQSRPGSPRTSSKHRWRAKPIGASAEP